MTSLKMILEYSSGASRDPRAPRPANIFNNGSPELDQRNREVREMWGALRERMDELGFLPQNENDDMFQVGGFELQYDGDRQQQQIINVDPDLIEIGPQHRQPVVRGSARVRGFNESLRSFDRGGRSQVELGIEGITHGTYFCKCCELSMIGGQTDHSIEMETKTCHFCGRGFRTVNLMKDHERFSHGVCVTPDNVCLLCHQAFENYDDVVNHFMTFLHVNPTMQGGEERGNAN